MKERIEFAIGQPDTSPMPDLRALAESVYPPDIADYFERNNLGNYGKVIWYAAFKRGWDARILHESEGKPE